MGPGPALKTMALRRRSLLLGAGAAALTAGCADEAAGERWQAHWVGASHERGHRLRAADPLAWPAGPPRRADVLIVGGGVAGLAAARAFMRRGVDDLRLFELEDDAGGNSRAHTLGGHACPLGAHYLPLPGPQAREVGEWLFELGLLRHELGRTRADERHLVHAPQERLFIDGAWVEGLLPPAEPGSATLAQYRRFAGLVTEAQQSLGFALPSFRAPWSAGLAALDAITFAAWLDARSLDDPRLRWTLDYACLDDYGAAADTVSAWAGLHYFASRHGFHVPGDDGEDDGEGLLTWPEGNAWLTRRLAAPLGDRLLTGRVVLRLREQRHHVDLLAWNVAADRLETWQAETVVLAVPLMVAARLVEVPPAPLVAAAGRLRHAPWLVANVLLDAPPLARPGAPPAWDNVAYGQRALGYVDAGHQDLRVDRQPTLLTAYEAWPIDRRAALLALDAGAAARHVLAQLAVMHPELPHHATTLALMRHGHAMAVPEPGVRGAPALAALRGQHGRLRFAHADLAGYSVFEEAFTLGSRVADPPG